MRKVLLLIDYQKGLSLTAQRLQSQPLRGSLNAGLG